MRNGGACRGVEWNHRKLLPKLSCASWKKSAASGEKSFDKPDIVTDGFGIETITFLGEIGIQEPHIGSDPEFTQDDQILVDLRWLTLDEIPERDRAYLWAAGLMSIPVFLEEVSHWGDELSYPIQ